MSRLPMRLIASALAAALLAACGVASAQQTGWVVLRAASYHAGEAPMQPGTGWLALMVVDGKWHLVPTAVTATAAPDMADEPLTWTGVEIKADAVDPIALLRAPGLKPGKVDTPDMRFENKPRLLQAGSSIAIAFRGREYSFDVRGKALELTLGAVSQRLVDDVGSADEDSTTSLLWAGDLDGDGQLDFLLETTGRNSESLCLYLSRPAAPGALVGGAGCLGVTGC